MHNNCTQHISRKNLPAPTSSKECSTWLRLSGALSIVKNLSSTKRISPWSKQLVFTYKNNLGKIYELLHITVGNFSPLHQILIKTIWFHRYFPFCLWPTNIYRSRCFSVLIRFILCCSFRLWNEVHTVQLYYWYICLWI